MTNTKSPLRERMRADGVDREVSITEAAEIKGVQPDVVRRWIARGELTAYRYGARLIRIRLSDLNTFGQKIGRV